MKTGKLILVTLVLSLALNIGAFAQRGQSRQACLNIPELSKEQQTKIEALRTSQLSKANVHRAQMDELRAKKRSLRIAQSPDMNEINNVIDQMTSLRGERMKANAEHHQNIRELLTQEQRAYFDARSGNRGRFEQRGSRGNDGRGSDRRPQQRSPRGGRR